MRKRGKKLLAIMLAASMAIGQSGTWTPAQENVAEAIEGAAPNAQTDDDLKILTEEETNSDDSENETETDTSDPSWDDTEDEPSGDEENGDGDTGGGTVPGDGGNTPGGNNLVGPGSDSETEQTGTTPTEEDSLDGNEQFTSGDENTVPTEDVEPDKTSQTANTEQTLEFAMVKNELVAGHNVKLNADITIPVDEQITISQGTVESPVILDLQHHKITFASERTTAPIIVSGSFKLEDTEPSESDNSNSTNTEKSDESGESEGEENLGESGEEESGEEKEEESEEQEEKPEEPEEDSEEKQEESGEEPKEETEITENEDQPQVDTPETDNPDAASATEGDTSIGMITGSDHGVFQLQENANLTISGGQISGITGAPVINVEGKNTTTLLTGGTFKNNGGDAIEGSIYHADYGKHLSTLTISGTTRIENNTGKSGGVICAAAAKINLEGEIVISGNTAKENGGVIYTSGNLENDGTDNGVSVTIAGGTISGNTANNGGAIYATQHSIITMSNGTISGNTATNNGGGICAEQNLNIDISGGTISGNKAKNGGGVYAYPNNAADVRVSISGGEIKDNTASENGGGIYMNGNAKMQMLNGSISTNEAKNGGGIYTSGNITLQMGGGTISGNTANENGGGIYSDQNTILNIGTVLGKNDSQTISGSTITGNTAEKNGGGVYTTGDTKLNMIAGTVSGNTTNSDDSNAHGYWTGGGGICAAGSTNFTLSGGEIKENHVNNGGGGAGIRIGISGDSPVFTMTGGTVSENIISNETDHNGAEGGGISVATGTATLSKGNIINNKAWTESWGGGGVFCSDKAIMKINSANVTANTAGGFGGGIAGCSTGRIFVFNNSNNAFYGNTAADPNDKANIHLSGGDSAKHEDHTYAFSNDEFLKNGYSDYFCALNSYVEKTMCGQPNAWTGSADGVSTTEYDKNDISEYYSASYMMGLTAKEGITFDSGSFELQITGNKSYTHGGGILCNGYLICGTPTNNKLEMNSRLELELKKELLNSDGTKADEYLKNNYFEFEIYEVENDKEKESPFITGVTDEKSIVFNKMIPIKQVGTYVYDIKEKPCDSTVKYDTSVYRISFDVIENTISADKPENKTGFDIVRPVIQEGTVKVCVKEGEIWKEITTYKYSSGDDKHSDKLSFTKEGNDAAFINQLLSKPISIKAVKKWSDSETVDHNNDSVTVQLQCDGKQVREEAVLSLKNNWSYTWEGLPSSKMDSSRGWGKT